MRRTKRRAHHEPSLLIAKQHDRGATVLRWEPARLPRWIAGRGNANLVHVASQFSSVPTHRSISLVLPWPCPGQHPSIPEDRVRWRAGPLIRRPETFALQARTDSRHRRTLRPIPGGSRGRRNGLADLGPSNSTHGPTTTTGHPAATGGQSLRTDLHVRLSRALSVWRRTCDDGSILTLTRACRKAP